MYVMDTKIHKKLEPLRDELSNIVFEYLINSGNKITQNKRLLVKSSVSCFILNTYYKVCKGINLCGVTLKTEHYSKNSIINGVKTNRKVSHRYTRILFDVLSLYGYITLNKGGIDEWGMLNGVWQPISFTNGFVEIHNKLIDLYNKYDFNHTQDDGALKNIIIVRDEHGVDVTFKTTEKVRIVKTMLKSYNTLTFNYNVTKGDKHYDVQMYKVYNGKTFEKGARNYMSGDGIQNLSSEERHKLTINGNNTAIFDYKSFEPSIAYSMCGEIMVGDPYELYLDGYDSKISRKLCKLFMLIMMNIENKQYLITSINEMIRTEFNVQKLYSDGKIPDKRIDVKDIVDKIENKHYIIRHMFYGNYHTQPSYIGSLVADYITDYFTQRGVLVLSVFDEFIIEESYADELYEVMLRAYEMILGSSVNCKITKEK